MHSFTALQPQTTRSRKRQNAVTPFFRPEKHTRTQYCICLCFRAQYVAQDPSQNTVMRFAVVTSYADTETSLHFKSKIQYLTKMLLIYHIMT